MINNVEKSNNKWKKCKYKIVAQYWLGGDHFSTFELPIMKDTTEYFESKSDLKGYFFRKKGRLLTLKLKKRFLVTPFFKDYYTFKI